MCITMKVLRIRLICFYGFTLGIVLSLIFVKYYFDGAPNGVGVSSGLIQSITQSVTVDDLIAISFWNKNDSKHILSEIEAERRAGIRDQYFIPKSYISNPNNSHFDDTQLQDQFQREVYLLARTLLRKLKDQMARQLTVIDYGCGSGWKLVHFLSVEFKTIGMDTEPAYSFLIKTYPNHTWYNANKDAGKLPNESQCDMGISADVIEHFRDPDLLIDVLKSFRCHVYVISTPKREWMSRTGPSLNIHHVREWTFHEFQLYLTSRGFKIIKSFDGVNNPSTQFHVVTY